MDKGKKSTRRILVKMTGSIAAYKACGLLSKLVQAGYEVQVAASSAALQFVGAATLEGLTGRPVVSDLWETGRAMDHINLMRWADLIIVAPASAHFVNRIAVGVGDNLLTTMFLAHDFSKPYLIAPAMNTSMYLNPITQSSIKKLREVGLGVLETASGVLACGEVGQGKLLDPDLLLAEIENALAKHSLQQSPKMTTSNSSSGDKSRGATSGLPQLKRMLVTSGGMSEPIDSVRSIVNTSSGLTGLAISQTFSDLGFDVVHLRTEGAKFTEFAERLQTQLREHFDWIIHCAAIADYSVRGVEVDGRLLTGGEKLPSGSDVTLKLQSNPKLVNRLKEWSKNSEVKVVAFKLTNQASELERKEAVAKLFSHSKVHFVVCNDKSEIDHRQNRHGFQIYDRDQRILSRGQLQADLMFELVKLIEEAP